MMLDSTFENFVILFSNSVLYVPLTCPPPRRSSIPPKGARRGRKTYCQAIMIDDLFFAVIEFSWYNILIGLYILLLLNHAQPGTDQDLLILNHLPFCSLLPRPFLLRSRITRFWHTIRTSGYNYNRDVLFSCFLCLLFSWYHAHLCVIPNATLSFVLYFWLIVIQRYPELWSCHQDV